MTPPLTPEALEQARALVRQSLKNGVPGLTETAREAVVRSIMMKLERQVLAPLLAAHQQGTAENESLRKHLESCALAVGYSPFASYPISTSVHRLRKQLATAEAASLRAEGEAKDRALLLLLPFVDYAAGEGLAFVETEDGEHPEMDAADIMAAAAEALGLELGSEAYLALLPAGYDAIRAARAATAREG